MEAIENIFQKRVQKILSSTNQNSCTTDETKKTEYECPICKDTGWLFDSKDNWTGKQCSCVEAKKYRKILECSGISEAFQLRNFENFKNRNYEILNIAKNLAMNYADNFEDIRNERHNSIAFLGQVGSGKTHLSISIANELMKRNIGVRYMQYREDIMKLKQVANDQISYQYEVNKYKTATVLLIDDLFKEAVIKRNGYRYVNDADLRVMFEIVNYRYFKGIPVIISSEYRTDDLLDFDEGLGSRIIHMCKGRIMELNGQELNYRLVC